VKTLVVFLLRLMTQDPQGDRERIEDGRIQINEQRRREAMTVGLPATPKRFSPIFPIV